MRALSIRQPYAELILRGIKTAEYRSRPTRIVGERFYIYASQKKWSAPCRNQRTVKTADNIVVPSEPLPEWMIELAEQVGMIEPGAILPTGVIVGSAVIEKVSELPAAGSGQQAVFQWHLVDIQRAKIFRKPRKHPQPVWFNPF